VEGWLWYSSAKIYVNNFLQAAYPSISFLSPNWSPTTPGIARPAALPKAFTAGDTFYLDNTSCSGSLLPKLQIGGTGMIIFFLAGFVLGGYLTWLWSMKTYEPAKEQLLDRVMSLERALNTSQEGLNDRESIIGLLRRQLVLVYREVDAHVREIELLNAKLKNRNENIFFKLVMETASWTHSHYRSVLLSPSHDKDEI
jgi:hypothetical protein